MVWDCCKDVVVVGPEEWEEEEEEGAPLFVRVRRLCGASTFLRVGYRCIPSHSALDEGRIIGYVASCIRLIIGLRSHDAVAIRVTRDARELR